MSPYRRAAVLVFLGAVALAGLALAADWYLCLPETAQADYVGQGACVDCHQRQCELWSTSDHERAMDLATPRTVLGDFEHGSLAHFGVTTTMSREGDRFFMTTDGPDGKLQKYPVKYVFGYRPLQQYLVEFPRGKLQCLPVAWDTVGKRWFHLYPHESIPHTDELHWTQPLQNWNYMCAECHSTNLQRNYKLATDSYHTTFSEINVSCETCHGPASLHVHLARSYRFFWDRKRGYGLAKLKTPENVPQIESCAPCHARRRIVAAGFLPGKPLLDYYYPELLDTENYYADGQILSEDYEYGSFIQSKMFHKNVRCSDCHDPHSLKVKFKDGPTITDNKLCGQCHLPSKYDTVAHHHHPGPDRRGTLCIECHMPKTTYMVVDPRLDHSIRIPRPQLTVDLGIPNACNGCHHDEKKGETALWAAETVRQWYGERHEPQHFAYALAAGRQNKPEGRALLDSVVRRKDVHEMARASALILLGNYGPDAALPAANEGLSDPDPLVRTAAVRSVQSLPPEQLLSTLGKMLSDPSRSVRTEAARALSAVPAQQFSAAERVAFDAALTEYVQGQHDVDEQPGSHLNLAVVAANQGRFNEAIASYQTALRLDPNFVPARMNLATLYDQMGKAAEAESQLRKVVELHPKLADARYSLGLVLASDPKRIDEATRELATAAELAPNNARIHYNLGLAYQHQEKADLAEAELKTAFKLSPANADFLRALTIFYVQQKRWARAAACAAELARLRPSDSQAAAWAEQLKRQAESE